MKSKYYNIWEFDQIVALIDTNPVEAKIGFEKYIEKYPRDYSAYSYYVYVLIILGYISEAEKFLEYSERLSSSDSFFRGEENRVSYFKYGNLLNKLRILSYKKNYEELNELYQEKKYRLDEEKFWGLDFYLKAKLGFLNGETRENKTYLFRQMMDYSENDFLDHIDKHLGASSSDDKSNSLFVVDFPVKRVFEEIKKYIPSDNRLFKGFFQDTYIFRYDNCGRDNNKFVDYFSVVCLHDTDSFITMCPASGCENLPYIDLNYLAHQQTPKIKTMSQIEKFNRRYRNGENL